VARGHVRRCRVESAEVSHNLITGQIEGRDFTGIHSTLVREAIFLEGKCVFSIVKEERGKSGAIRTSRRVEMNRNAKWNVRVISLVAIAAVAFLSVGALARPKAASKDIVDTAVAAGSFKTLAAALQAAGLVDTLKGAGPYTVFAPTDEAFAKLPAGTVDELLKPENKEKLVAILTYHVVPGDVMAAKVMKMTSAKTVNGQSVTISTKGGTVMVDNAKVVKADIACSNGVIHVIDTVLMPK
jgi:uncharacterized surface protein with fasciclin (FAS1) repeats